MNFLKNRRFQLESLEERTLLTAVPWSTGDDAPVVTAMVITDAIPVVDEVDDPTASVGEGANLITEADPGDTIYVSVYAKSTDAAYGITGGYCTLYFDNTGFTPGDFTPSSIYSTLTMNDTPSVSCSTDEYISAFGGFPSNPIAVYGKTQWALAGTQEFTVSADASGDYVFWNGIGRTNRGTERLTWNFIRQDYPSTLDCTVDFTSTTITVKSAVTPDIEGVTVEGYEGVYDGSAYGVTVSGTEEGDVILYSTDGENYSEDAVTVKFGEETVYVKVQREGYNDWNGSADIAISAATITVTGTTVADKAYDGTTDATITLGEVSGVIEGDDVTVEAAGAFESALPGDYEVTVTYTLAGDDAVYYVLAANSDVCAATIHSAVIPDIEGVTVEGYEGVYDGSAYGVTVSGTEEGDVILYSTDGENYSEDAVTVKFGEETVYVKVQREGYNDWNGSADIAISAATITVTGTTVADKDYDGTTDAAITLGEVSGVIEGDDVTVEAAGAFESALPGDYEVTVSYTLAGDDAGYYVLAANSDVCAATINALDIDDVAVLNVIVDFDYLPHSIEVVGGQEGDVVTYTYQGVTYEENPEFYGDRDVDSTYEVTVTVSRVGYNDFTAVGTLTILASDVPLPGSLIVDTLEDIVDSTDDVNSLREAIAYAATLQEVGVQVTFAEGLEGTITLANGALVIDSEGSFAIDGAGVITIDASGESRIFEINSGDITISGLALLNGFDADKGAAIYNAGTLTVESVSVTDSVSGRVGGAIYTGVGTVLTVNDSTFVGNSAPSHGGAIFVEKEAIATISDSYFSGNSTVSYGSALYMWSDSVVTVESSIFVDNIGPNGTIRNHEGTLTLASVVLVGNTQALASSNAVNIASNVTISGNTRSAIRADKGASYVFENSILLGKRLYETDATVTVDGDYNLSTQAFGTNFITYDGSDLFAEDGYTLAGENQAFNAGNDDYVVTDHDAVGNVRVIGGAVDLGAVELIGSASGKTVVFNGSVPDLVEFSGPVTWQMYSEDGEDWSDEYTYRDAGEYTFYVWCGDDDADAIYQVTATILPLQLTVEGSTVKRKGADGTTDATVIVGDVATLYDDVTVTATGEFESAEIGTWDVAVTYAVSGAKAGNYIAPAAETLVGEIVQKEAPSMVVTTTEDIVDDTDGLISLREAVTVYFGTDGNKTVTFADDLGAFNLAATIELNASNDGLVIDGGEKVVFDGGSATVFFLNNDADVTFKDITFQNINAGDSFGSVFACAWGMQDSNWSKTVTFDGCSFLNNSAAYGSVMMVTGTSLDILDCYFAGNTGSGRGVIWSIYNSGVYVGDSTFENNVSEGDGGAIRSDTEVREKTLMVVNSSFTGNSTTGKGGAIYSENEVLKIYDSAFTGNHAGGEGGAVYATHWGSAYFSNLTPAVVTLRRDVFEGNSSNSNGGAVMVMAGNLQDTNSTFTGNFTSGENFARGGAVYFDYGTGATNFNGTVFTGNHTSGNWSGMGGAVFTAATGFGTATNHRFNFNGVTFTGNEASPTGFYYAEGGAVYVGSGYNTFNDCTFTENAAYIADDSTGGGMVRGGAVYAAGAGGTETRFYNCTLTHNYAGGNAEGSTYQKTDVKGGAIFDAGTTVHIIQSQITDNVAYGDSYGGGYAVDNVPSSIWWSTIAGNQAARGADLYNDGAVTALYSIILESTTTNALDFNATLYESVANSGRFSPDAASYELQEGDVLFNLGGYTLAPHSVAIDGTGQTEGWFATDLNGDARVRGFYADYGAFEYQADVVSGATVTFNGQYQAPITINNDSVTWIMYSFDGEDWSDEPLTRDAGEYTFYVWAGDDDGNEFQGQVTGTITPLQLTVSGSTVKTKAADGTTTAEVVVGDVATLYDSVTVSATGEFESAEIGTWDVAVTYSVSGEKAGNYIAPVDETLQGEIKEPEAASMVVTTADDIVDATDGLISLREALTVYFGTDGNKTVTFAEGITDVNADAKFILGASHDGLVIDGAGVVTLGNLNETLFVLDNFETANLTFKGLSFENLSGDAHGSALSATHGFATGRESNRNTITFEDCTFTSNTNTGSGGVMTVFGIDLVVKGSTFRNNNSGYGTIWVGFCDLTVEDSTFSWNSGGAIHANYGGDCTITVSGSSFDSNTKNGWGGAIYTEFANTYIYDSVFTGNAAARDGGALSTADGANTTKAVVVEGCEFLRNRADGGSGGALRIFNFGGNTLTLTDSIFDQNTATSAGGAVELTGCTYTITGSKFTANQANGSFTDGGAIHASYGGDCRIDDCLFVDNVATGAYAGKGGAIHFTDQNGSVMVINSTFEGNQSYAPNYYWAYGGAICRESGNGTLNLYNNKFVGNLANAHNGGDGTLSAFGGGVYMSGSGVLNVVQCLIAENEAFSDSSPSYGGGLFIDGNVASAIYYSTITNNRTAGTTNSVGGGIFNSGSTTILYSIVTGNESPADSLWSGGGADIFQGNNLTLSNTIYDADGILNGYTLEGDYNYAIQDGDILFAEDSYKLAPHSVAIDATDRATVPFSSTLHGKDLDGGARLVGLRVDNGAFEYQDLEAYVIVTLSDALPNQETSSDVPVSTISTAAYGETVYAQVWVKSVDGSTASLSGGFVDIVYDDAVFEIVAADPSSLFADEFIADISVAGLVSTFGGLASVDGEDVGVDSWALLGTITFTVTVGEGEVTATIPTLNGVPLEALDISRTGEGAIPDAGLVYRGATITVTPAAPEDLTVSSNGANSHLLTWSDAHVSTYTVAYTTDGENWTEVTVDGLSTVISGLTYGTSVTYKVAAVGGPWSNTVTLNVCPMDIDGDGSIGPTDLALFRDAFLSAEGDDNWNPAADIDGDGIVGPADYSFLRANWLKDADDDDLVYPPALADLDAAFESLDADDLGVDFDVF